MFILKLALRPWKVAPFSQIFSSFAVGFLLLLMGFLHWIQSGLDPVLDRLKHEQVITAYIGSEALTEGQGAEEKILDSIRLSLGAKAETAEISVVEATEFLDELRAHYPDLARELEDLGPEMHSVIPRYVSVSGFLDESAVEKVKAVPGVESAETSRDRYQHIVGAFTALRWVSRLLAIGMGLALLTGLIHLSRMNAFLHSEALSLLRLWGAGEMTLRAPGAVSALCVGLIGGALACAGWFGGGQWLSLQIRELSPMLNDMHPVSAQFGLALLAFGVLAGGIAGALTGTSYGSRST